MTLDKARELLAIQAELGGGYNRNAVKLIWMKSGRNTAWTPRTN
jgi:hypothetical protein